MWHGRRMLKVAIRSLLDSRLHGAPPNRAFHMTRGCCDIAQASGSAQKIRLPPHTGESIDYLSRLDRWRLVTGRIYLPCVRSTCCWSSLAPAIVDTELHLSSARIVRYESPALGRPTPNKNHGGHHLLHSNSRQCIAFYTVYTIRRYEKRQGCLKTSR